MKATKSKNTHIGFRNQGLFCFNCGGSMPMKHPIPLSEMNSVIDDFTKKHQKCKKNWTIPINEQAEQKTESENITWWLENGEQGTSSKTMLKYLADFEVQGIEKITHPCDPDDFRRCYLLLQAVPQFKIKLYKLKPISPIWENLVNNWQQLTKMLEEQLAGKKNNMYEFMRNLGC